MENRYTITELASILGVHIQTLRKYEQDFSLLIPRDESNARYYTDNEKGLFENIMRMKKEGLTTKAILKLLGRSVDATEQREQVLDLMSVEKITGEDLRLLVKKAITETLQEALAAQEEKFEYKIKEMQDEHRKEMEKFFNQQASENEKLREYIQEQRKQEDKKGFLSRIFGK